MATLEKHFDRHLRVIEACSATKQIACVDAGGTQPERSFRASERGGDRSREARGGVDRKRRKFFEDAIVSHGERLSAALLAAVLSENKVAAANVDARRCIITDDDYGCAAPLMTETFRKSQQHLQPLIESSTIPVLGGFIGSTLTGETTTLGRGGSDYTAAIIGAALDANEIQIWTDVPGVLTADPRLVPAGSHGAASFF